MPFWTHLFLLQYIKRQKTPRKWIQTDAYLRAIGFGEKRLTSPENHPPFPSRITAFHFCFKGDWSQHFRSNVSKTVKRGEILKEIRIILLGSCERIKYCWATGWKEMKISEWEVWKTFYFGRARQPADLYETRNHKKQVGNSCWVRKYALWKYMRSFIWTRSAPHTELM